MTEKELTLWLCSQKELYRIHQEKLRDYFGELEELYFHAAEAEINSLPFLSPAQKKSILYTRKSFDPVKYQNDLSSGGIRFISIQDADYPKRLLAIPDPPYGLFCLGRLPDDESPSAAIIGARLCSAYGRHYAEEIAQTLSEAGVSIISGMARGIDGIAQRRAVACGGSSFAVLGSGVDVCYPKENKLLYHNLQEKGGILSEYPPGREPLALHFPMRNRIISGLADLVIITEAKAKSGTLITADMALEQSRDVVAVPGRLNDPLSMGCNLLISQGAGVYLGPNELLERIPNAVFTKTLQRKTHLALASDENMVYSVLEFQTLNLQTIQDRTKLNASEALTILTRLQIKGYIRETAKNYYEKI